MSEGRVLITGATGFVGRHLVADLEAAGIPLTLATRRAGQATVRDGTTMVPVGEIDGRTAWGEALQDVDCVVHLAAHVHVAPERAESEAARFEAVNRDGSARLFAEAAARGVGCFVFMSSITVLGSKTAPGAPFDHASPPRPTTPYARSKLAAEDALVDLSRGTATRLVVLRPPLVCGPGVKGNLASLLRLAALPLPLPLGRIDNRRTLLSIRNLVSALRAVIASPEPACGTYVLGDRRPMSTTGIVAALRAGMGRRPGLFHLPPEFALRAARLLGREGVHRRLFGDLEVDSTAFRRAFAWSDEVDTPATLRQTAVQIEGRRLR